MQDAPRAMLLHPKNIRKAIMPRIPTSKDIDSLVDAAPVDFLQQLSTAEERERFIEDIVMFADDRLKLWREMAKDFGYTQTQFNHYCHGLKDGIDIILALTDSRELNLASYRLTTNEGKIIQMGCCSKTVDLDTKSLVVRVEEGMKKHVLHAR